MLCMLCTSNIQFFLLSCNLWVALLNGQLRELLCRMCRHNFGAQKKTSLYNLTLASEHKLTKQKTVGLPKHKKENTSEDSINQETEREMANLKVWKSLPECWSFKCLHISQCVSGNCIICAYSIIIAYSNAIL